MIVSFTGHRPDKDPQKDKLGTGYSITNERVKAYSDLLVQTLLPLIQQEGAHTFISGGALGVDQIAFWTVERIKKEYNLPLVNILAIPFRLQYSNWYNQDILTWYHRMFEYADNAVFVDTLPEYEVRTVPIGEYSGAKMQLRNEYMVNNSDVVVAVWNGTKGGTGNCVKYAQEQNKRIVRVQPIQF